MPKFIEVHSDLINIEDISRVEFLSEDVYTGLFPKDESGTIICDYVVFPYARIYTFSGQEFEMSLELYQPEDDETEDMWFSRNRSYISQSMTTLNEALGSVIRVTGYEYQD